MTIKVHKDNKWKRSSTISVSDTHNRSSHGCFEQRIETRMVGLEALLQRIPKILTQETTLDPNSYVESPFTLRITEVQFPRKFSTPTFKLYDGTTDPDKHIAVYKQKILAINLQAKDRKACMYRIFGTSLAGLALQ